MSIMAVGVLLHWTQANSFELVVRQRHERPQRRIQEGAIEAIVHPKTYELTLFSMIVYNS